MERARSWPLGARPNIGRVRRHKKAPEDTGAFCPLYRHLDARSVLRDHGATPVEPIDQRGADGLHQRMEVDSRPGAYVRDVVKNREVTVVKVSSAVFSFHEQARCRNTEEVQAVLDAAANEPSLSVEAVGVETGWRNRSRVEQGSTRPTRAGVTAIDVGKHAWRHQVANASAYCPSIPKLLVIAHNAVQAKQAIADRTLQAAKLTVGQNAEHPALAKLPIVARTDRTVPAVAALLVGRAKNASTRRSVDYAGICVPHAAADTAEDIEAGPARDRGHHRGFGIGPGRKVSRNGRSGKRRTGNERDGQLHHNQIPNQRSKRCGIIPGFEPKAVT